MIFKIHIYYLKYLLYTHLPQMTYSNWCHTVTFQIISTHILICVWLDSEALLTYVNDIISSTSTVKFLLQQIIQTVMFWRADNRYISNPFKTKLIYNNSHIFIALLISLQSVNTSERLLTYSVYSLISISHPSEDEQKMIYQNVLLIFYCLI